MYKLFTHKSYFCRNYSCLHMNCLYMSDDHNFYRYDIGEKKDKIPKLDS